MERLARATGANTGPDFVSYVYSSLKPRIVQVSILQIQQAAMSRVVVGTNIAIWRWLQDVLSLIYIVFLDRAQINVVWTQSRLD